MPARPHIDLVAKLNRSCDRPDYDIFAGEQLVGRIYLMHVTSNTESWCWGLNTITFDSSIGPPEMTRGYSDSLAKAQASFRVAFDRWLEWARALPSWDLKHKKVWRQLKNMGAA
jgi:hypothetical protein